MLSCLLKSLKTTIMPKRHYIFNLGPKDICDAKKGSHNLCPDIKRGLCQTQIRSNPLSFNICFSFSSFSAPSSLEKSIHYNEEEYLEKNIHHTISCFSGAIYLHWYLVSPKSRPVTILMTGFKALTPKPRL